MIRKRRSFISIASGMSRLFEEDFGVGSVSEAASRAAVHKVFDGAASQDYADTVATAEATAQAAQYEEERCQGQEPFLT